MEPWIDKANRIIKTLSEKSYRDANIMKNGRKRKIYVPYSIPELAENLVQCISEGKEMRAKALFLSYDGMKSINRIDK